MPKNNAGGKVEQKNIPCLSNRFCAAIVMKNNAAASHSKIFRGSLKQKYSAGETANSAGKNHNGAFAIGNIHSGSSKKAKAFHRPSGKFGGVKSKKDRKISQDRIIHIQ